MALILTQQEADRLISMLKKTVDECVVFPNKKGGLSFDVIGEHRNNEFVINIDRKGVNFNKCTYQGRVKQSNQILMRLDVDPNARHTNPPPDYELIIGPHLHIYTEGYDMKYAIPFDINNKSLYELCYVFFHKFNVIEPPQVIYQETL